MSTFIRGVPGIIELITRDRDEAVYRLAARPVSGTRLAMKATSELEGQVRALNYVLATVEYATILPEEQYDAMMAQLEQVKPARVWPFAKDEVKA